MRVLSILILVPIPVLVLIVTVIVLVGRIWDKEEGEGRTGIRGRPVVPPGPCGGRGRSDGCGGNDNYDKRRDNRME